MSKQIEMVSLEDLVPQDNVYRRFEELFNFEKIKHRLSRLEKNLGRSGYGIVRLFKCLLYQFMEDLSDRELEGVRLEIAKCRSYSSCNKKWLKLM